MGKYIQLGICHRITVYKEELEELKLTESDLTKKLNESMDMSLFTCNDDGNQLCYSLQDEVLMEQLPDFLRSQYSLYPAKEAEEAFRSVLLKISQKESAAEIIELANEKSSAYFQSSHVYNFIETAFRKRLRIDLSLMLLFVEGKIIMECYTDFLRYLENLVRSNSKLPIAGAFRAVIE
ncbi:hypothetical protein [Paenibacillus sp. GCM10027626]|uniref:hypothetical protein n=1 Tax=Paenibacillus sp. GCM10027626 TaxID=3273411 RepID=UPI003631FD0F